MAADRAWTQYNASMAPPDVENTLHIVRASDAPLMNLLGIKEIDVIQYGWNAYHLARPTSVVAGEAETTVTAGTAAIARRIQDVAGRIARDWHVSLDNQKQANYAITDMVAFRKNEKAIEVIELFENWFHWATHVEYNGVGANVRPHGLIPWLADTGAARNAGSTTLTIGPNTSLEDEYFSYLKDFASTAMTETTFNDTLGAYWALGAPSHNLVFLAGEKVKRQISEWQLRMSTVANYTVINQTQQTEMQSRLAYMDHYTSDVASFWIALDRNMVSTFSHTATNATSTTSDDAVVRGDVALVGIDPAFFKIAQFRGIEHHDLARTDDSVKGYVTGRMGIQVGHPLAGIVMTNCGGEGLTA